MWRILGRLQRRAFPIGQLVAVGSIFHLVFIIFKPTKMSISGDESGAELSESSLSTFPETNEENDPLRPDEFQKFISIIPTTVTKNDT
jgi:hypothetical protein